MSRWTPSSSTDRLRAALEPLGLLLAVGVLYGAALGFPFVYDDRVLIEGNRLLGQWSELPGALTADLFHGTGVRPSPYWRPVVTLSYFVDHAIGAGEAWAFHLTNLVLVGAVAWLLARSLADAGVAWAWAWAVLWLAWPTQVEAACNITGRTDLLAALFSLAALRARTPAVAGACLLLALGSKEVALLVPVAAWLMRPADRRLAVLVGLSVVWLGARAWVLSRLGIAADDAAQLSLDGLIGLGAQTTWTLAGLIDPGRVAGMEVPRVGFPMLGWLLLAAAGLAAAALRGRRPLAAAGLGLGLGAAALVSGLATDQLRWGDTLVLFPSLALVWMAAETRRASPVALLVVAFGAAVVGHARVDRWSSELALWTSAHEARPDDARLRLNLARTLAGQDPTRGVALLEGVDHVDPRISREIAATHAFHLLELQRADEALPRLLAARAPDPEAAWANAMACVLLPPAHSEAVATCELALTTTPEEGAVQEALDAARSAQR